MQQSKRGRRGWKDARSALLLASVFVMVGCRSPVIGGHPAPESPCPPPEADYTLGQVLGWAARENPERDLELWELGKAYADAGAYCRMSQEALGGR